MLIVEDNVGQFWITAGLKLMYICADYQIREIPDNDGILIMAMRLNV